MKFPLVSCEKKTLIVSGPEIYQKFGKIDMKAAELEMSVTRSGRAELEWILDADGIFYELESMGMLRPSLAQRLGFSRVREKFRILPGRRVSVRELATRISGLHDKFEEAPNVADLKKLLDELAPQHILGREEMFKYLGE